MTSKFLRVVHIGGIVVSLVLMFAAVVHGQVKRGIEVVVSGGGGTSSGSNITLRSTIGQVGTSAMSGSSVQLDGGFWPAVFISDQSSTPITDQPSDELPSEFELQPAYPNPFNPSTKIEYSLPEARHVRLAVYNAAGRRVKTLVDERQPAGDYQINFHAGELSSGLYFYRLRSGSYRRVRAVTLIK